MAPITVTAANNTVSIFYGGGAQALSLTAATYPTIEELCEELEVQLKTVQATFTVTIQADDTSDYGVTVKVLVGVATFYILDVDGWAQFGFDTLPTGAASSQTSTGEVKNTLVATGVGLDTLGPISARAGSAVSVDGSTSISQNSTLRRRTIAWNGVTDELASVGRDIWDSAFAGNDLYYVSDWEGLVSDNASERMNQLVIDYGSNSVLSPQRRGNNSGLWDFQIAFIVKD